MEHFCSQKVIVHSHMTSGNIEKPVSESVQIVLWKSNLCFANQIDDDESIKFLNASNRQNLYGI